MLAKFVLNRFRIGGGAEANFNLVGDTFYRYRVDGNKTREREKELALNKFSYNFVGLVGMRTSPSSESTIPRIPGCSPRAAWISTTGPWAWPWPCSYGIDPLIRMKDGYSAPSRLVRALTVAFTLASFCGTCCVPFA